MEGQSLDESPFPASGLPLFLSHQTSSPVERARMASKPNATPAADSELSLEVGSGPSPPIGDASLTSTHLPFEHIVSHAQS